MAKVVSTSVSSSGYEQKITVRTHKLTSDLSSKQGGKDSGPTPHEIFLAGLGACTAMTLQMVARLRKFDLQQVVVTVVETTTVDPKDASKKIPLITEDVELTGNLIASEISSLTRAANRCPVYRLFTGAKQIVTSVTHVVASSPSKSGGSGSGGSKSGSKGKLTP